MSKKEKPVFVPTQNRGLPLLEEVMTYIELLSAKNIAVTSGRNSNLEKDSKVLRSGAAWNQADWHEVFLRLLPKKTPLVRVGAINDEYDHHSMTRDVYKLPEGPSCGTSHCFAGWASTLVGDCVTINMPMQYRDVDNLTAGKLVKMLELSPGNQWRTQDNLATERGISVDGEMFNSVEERAADLLGLSRENADILFDGTNDVATLRKYVERLKRGEDLEDEE